MRGSAERVCHQPRHVIVLPETECNLNAFNFVQKGDIYLPATRTPLQPRSQPGALCMSVRAKGSPPGESTGKRARNEKQRRTTWHGKVKEDVRETDDGTPCSHPGKLSPSTCLHQHKKGTERRLVCRACAPRTERSESNNGTSPLAACIPALSEFFSYMRAMSEREAHNFRCLSQTISIYIVIVVGGRVRPLVPPCPSRRRSESMSRGLGFGLGLGMGSESR